MSDIAWEISHSVETQASLPCAWNFMANISNWSDPPATFELDGPFQTGSRGTTHMPGQEPRHWTLADVRAPESYVVEAGLGGATLSVTWRFDGLAGGGTRLTQRIVLRGENDAAVVEQVRAAFTPGLAPGMSRIAGLMEGAEAAAS